jgi:octaprenyl-diphosphate synthase
MGLEQVTELVAEELNQMEEVLAKELSSDFPLVDELGKYVGRNAGKRLRPAVLFLSAKTIAGVSPTHIQAAAAVELIHTATLVHDDILDGATMRRRVAAINSRWGPDTAILLGDYLFSRAFTIASPLADGLIPSILAQTTNIVCEGELVQTLQRNNLELKENDYLRIISRKTASLWATCPHLGAILSGTNGQEAEALKRYGWNLGMAFQIMDDLLDITGDERVMGKSLGTDVALGKVTLPVIWLLSNGSKNAREETLAILQSESTDKRASLKKIIEQTNAAGYSLLKARKYVASGMQQIEYFPRSRAKEALLSLGEHILNQKNKIQQA